MLSNGTHREFRRTAVEEANGLLKGWMQLPFPTVGGLRNTGQLPKLYRALDEPSQGRASHTRSRCCFADGRSVQDRFHSSHIAQKMFPLLFIEERGIKGRKQIRRPPSFFLLKVDWLGEELSLHVAAFQIGGERIWKNRRGVGSKTN